MNRFDRADAAELLDLTPVLFCTATPDGRFRSVGPGWAEVLGVASDRLVGISLLEFVHPDDRGRSIEAMERIRAGHTLSNFVSRYIRPDDSRVHLNWSAAQHDDVVYVAATDVSKQARDAASAHGDRTKLGLVEEISGVGHWRVELGDEPSYHWSDEVFRIHGRDPSTGSPRGLDILAHYPDADHEMIISRARETIAGGKDFEFQLPMTRLDGVQRIVFAKGILQSDERGEFPSLVGISEDVTDRVLMQRRLLNEERLKSVSLLAAGIAHEINNPLQYITANASFARMALAKGDVASRVDELDRLLSDIEAGAMQVAGIVQDLRAFMSAQDRETVDVDLTKALRTAASMTRADLSRRAQFEVSLKTLPTVRGDAAQVVQVIVNLLINAGHAVAHLSSADATVTLRAWTAANGDATIELEDNGVGVPEKDLSRIFEPFYSTREEGEGSGLGLHVSRGIVEAMGGTLEARSQPGETIFRVTLPAAEPSA